MSISRGVLPFLAVGLTILGFGGPMSVQADTTKKVEPPAGTSPIVFPGTACPNLVNSYGWPIISFVRSSDFDVTKTQRENELSIVFQSEKQKTIEALNNQRFPKLASVADKISPADLDGSQNQVRSNLFEDEAMSVYWVQRWLNIFAKNGDPAVLTDHPAVACVGFINGDGYQTAMHPINNRAAYITIDLKSFSNLTQPGGWGNDLHFAILSHEFGHYIYLLHDNLSKTPQTQRGMLPVPAAIRVDEQRADCTAGFLAGMVLPGGFQIGFRDRLASSFSAFVDFRETSSAFNHGSGEERATAFKFGFDAAAPFIPKTPKALPKITSGTIIDLCSAKFAK